MQLSVFFFTLTHNYLFLCTALCQVEWPGPTGLAATFNRTVWRVKGEVVSTEMRAFNNLGGTRGTDDHTTAFIGLDGFGPNINMARDPRWGRNSEVPGECPLLSGQYAAHYVRGMQNGDDARYLKMAAQVKHYALYSVEAGREGFIPANVSMHDLFDYYLPQFRTAFVDGGASGAMCSYAGANFTPACANAYLLQRVLREHWQQNDTVVSTDCGAIDNFLSAHGSHFAFNRPDAAAKAINGGADVDLGDAYYAPVAVGGNGALATAVQADLVKVAVVRAAVRRVLRRRMRLGQFDPLERQVYTDTRTYGASAVNSTAAHAAVLEATLQSLVLLRNEQATLPLVVGARTALIGPHAVSQRDLMEGYKGDRACYTADGSDSNACVQTLGSVYARMNGAPSLTTVVKGVDIASDDASGIPAALDAAQAADQIILCLGLGQEVERETLDRQRIDLPPLQQKLAQAVLRVAGGKVRRALVVSCPVHILRFIHLLPHALTHTSPPCPSPFVGHSTSASCSCWSMAAPWRWTMRPTFRPLSRLSTRRCAVARRCSSHSPAPPIAGAASRSPCTARRLSMSSR